MGELSHLDELEAEAIYIIREVAAECEKPVMLYSIGKDSSVMLHLAMKAFYPEKPNRLSMPLGFEYKCGILHNIHPLYIFYVQELYILQIASIVLTYQIYSSNASDI